MSDEAMSAAAAIPAELLLRIQELKPILAKQGAVIRDGGRCRLRFRGVNGDYLHHSVSLPNGDVADAVTALIASWRVKEDRVDPERVRARVARRELAELRAAVALSLGGGPRLQRRGREWLSKALKDPWEKLRFIASGRVPVSPRKRGRPRRSRLW